MHHILSLPLYSTDNHYPLASDASIILLSLARLDIQCDSFFFFSIFLLTRFVRYFHSKTMTSTMLYHSLQQPGQPMSVYTYQQVPQQDTHRRHRHHHRHHHHRASPQFPTISSSLSQATLRVNNPSRHDIETSPATLPSPSSAYFLDRIDLESYSSAILNQTVETVVAKTKAKGERSMQGTRSLSHRLPPTRSKGENLLARRWARDREHHRSESIVDIPNVGLALLLARFTFSECHRRRDDQSLASSLYASLFCIDLSSARHRIRAIVSSTSSTLLR